LNKQSINPDSAKLQIPVPGVQEGSAGKLACQQKTGDYCMMRLLLSSVVAIAWSGTAAQAQELTVSAGGEIVSEYVSSGIRYSDGVAFQPYVELGFGGAYAGVYTTNIDPDLTGADRETGLSLGYRGEAGSFSYDLSVSHYMYSEAFEDFPVEDYAEVLASGTVAASEALYVTGDVGIAPEFDQTNLSLRVDYYTPVEGLSLDATYGRLEADFGAWNYWSAGATYQIAESVGFGLAYHDSDVSPDLGLSNTDGLLVATLSFDFRLR
jgi:uncharacterized protein (TIGR02001 family)